MAGEAIPVSQWARLDSAEMATLLRNYLIHYDNSFSVQLVFMEADMLAVSICIELPDKK